MAVTAIDNMLPKFELAPMRLGEGLPTFLDAVSDPRSGLRDGPLSVLLRFGSGQGRRSGQAGVFQNAPGSDYPTP